MIQNRPVGTTASLVSLLVLVASYAGVDITAEAAAAIIGGLSAIVSIFTPRNT